MYSCDAQRYVTSHEYLNCRRNSIESTAQHSSKPEMKAFRQYCQMWWARRRRRRQAWWIQSIYISANCFRKIRTRTHKNSFGALCSFIPLSGLWMKIKTMTENYWLGVCPLRVFFYCCRPAQPMAVVVAAYVL